MIGTATTPGDDRGRELVRVIDHALRQAGVNDDTHDVDGVAQDVAVHVRRALAAPAETVVPTGSLFDAIGNAVYEAGVGRSGPDPTWHGVATAAERAARAWFSRRAAPAETKAGAEWARLKFRSFAAMLESEARTVGAGTPDRLHQLAAKLRHLAATPLGPEAPGDAMTGPATTPGGNRGRELAELNAAADTLNDWLAELDVEDQNGPSSEVLDAIGVVLRAGQAAALAAPAETRAGSEVGNVAPLWWSPTRGVIQADEDAYSTVRSAGWTLVAHLPDDAVRLAATPPAPEGEAAARGLLWRWSEFPAGSPAEGADATGRPARRRSPWDRRELRIVVEANVDLFDVEAAETAARNYGVVEHIDLTVVTAVAAVPGLTDVRSVDTSLRDRRDRPDLADSRVEGAGDRESSS